MPPRLAAPPAAAGFFVKFNNADIYEVIHTLGRTAGINYLIDPRVRGVVNVHTQGMLRKDGALDLLFSILKINGATAIKEGDTYHIVPISEAKTEPLMPSVQGDGPSKGPANQVTMRAFPLQYISVAEMAKVIRPFLTPGGEAVEVGRANILLVIDTLANLEKTARLVELFDSEVFRAAGMKLFRLKVLDPEEMARNLENIFGALDFSATRGAKPAGINFVPIPRLYSLLVVSASPKTMEDVEKWIGELDRTGGGASRAVYRYRVKYGKVKDVAAVLEKLPSRTAPVAAGKGPSSSPRFPAPGPASWRAVSGAATGWPCRRSPRP
jgi:general secretion pathway protein D